MATLKELQNADDELKDLVFGFVRESKVHHSLDDIPSDITYLCLLYLFEPEYFDEIGNQTIVSNNKMTITKDGDDHIWNNTTYCKQSISSMTNKIISWTSKMGSMDAMCIGITSTTDCKSSDFSYNSSKNPDSIYYAISHAGIGFFNKDNDNATFKGMHRISFETGDTVTFILNLFDKTVSLKVNGSDAVILWEDIKIGNDISYKFAVSLINSEDSVTLLDFTQA